MGQAFLYGNGSGSGAGGTLTVSAPSGVTVTVSKDGKTKTKIADSSGVAVFKGLKEGTWTVTITDGEKTATKDVTVTTDYSTAISFNKIPEFIYSDLDGYEIVNDADDPITTSQDNWKIRFLKSGTLIFTSLNGAEDSIEVFLVGGGGGGSAGVGYSGGGGGGGGYTKTLYNLPVECGVPYEITVGAGGAESTYASTASASFAAYNGESTTAFGETANGGNGAGAAPSTGGATGGDGGSAGGKGSSSSNTTAGEDGGSNGGNCTDASGQGTTTAEFGDSNGKKYAGGGAGGGGQSTDASTAAGGTGGSIGGGDGGSGGKNGTAGEPGISNTGGGGGGGGSKKDGAAGGSGIVIIRNARPASATINITYPADSTCTATNGTTILTAPDTSGTWACNVTKKGTWSITAANGEKTKTSTVLIAEDGQTESVTLQYITYLFNKGDICDALTGGWYTGSSSAGSARIIEQQIIIVANAEKQYSSGPKNKIDVSEYETLSVTVDSVGNGTLTIYVYSTSISNPAAKVSTSVAGTVGIDISSVTGENAITLAVYSEKGATFKISEVSLA